MKQKKWHKVFIPQEGCELIDAIPNDPMVNWEQEPAYVLITMVACMSQDAFKTLMVSYQIEESRFKDVIRMDGNDVWIDICKAKIKKVWEDHPELYIKVLDCARQTDPHFQMGYCTLEGAVQSVIMGNSAKDISKAFARMKAPLSAEHYLYIGRELQRMENCLEQNLIYVQD